MVSEGIFNGDYVIVEQSQLHTTGLDGLLLIVRYLPRYSNIDPSTATEDEINANLEGPSLKYVRILEEREGLFYRLGIRSLLGSANQQIEAKYIVIEGRVIGIYRQIIR